MDYFSRAWTATSGFAFLAVTNTSIMVIASVAIYKWTAASGCSLLAETKSTVNVIVSAVW